MRANLPFYEARINMLDGDLVANEIVDEAKLKKIHALCLR